MFAVNSLEYRGICLFILILATTGAPIPQLESTETNSSQTKNLACVGFCPSVEVNIAPSPIKLTPSGNCFSADSWLQLIDGSKDNIGEIRNNDQLWSFDGVHVVPSEMILMLDKNAQKEATFFTFETESNHTISLTAEHLIPIVSVSGIPTYVPARHVKAQHDALYVFTEDRLLVQSLVRRISVETKLGFFAPLTTTGTILVNNVLASCFSNIHSHTLGQYAMGPVRWYYALSRRSSLIKSFADEKDQAGLHWIPELMLSYARQIYPSALHYS